MLARSALSSGSAEPVDTGRSRFMMGGMAGGGGAGTLQALLTELSGLKKPRGLINRVGRRVLGMRPKPPPKYRILVMMATNMPEALDEVLLRPGRIDRIGYPTAVIEGREGTSVDGSVYADADFLAKLEDHHSAAAGAHQGHTSVKLALPAGGRLPTAPAGGNVGAETAAAAPHDAW